MDKDIDIPWMLVAMIVIYFVSWVFNKIKGGGEEEDNDQPKRTLAEVQANRKRHLERQAQRESKSNGTDADPASALRQLFESITEENESPRESFLPEADPVVSAPAPPPLRQSQRAQTPPPLTHPPRSTSTSFQSKTPSAPDLSPAEKKALKKIQGGAYSISKARKKHSSRSLRSMIRGRGLRQAVVLKEILDQPRAMKPY